MEVTLGCVYACTLYQWKFVLCSDACELYTLYYVPSVLQSLCVVVCLLYGKEVPWYYSDVETLYIHVHVDNN